MFYLGGVAALLTSRLLVNAAAIENAELREPAKLEKRFPTSAFCNPDNLLRAITKSTAVAIPFCRSKFGLTETENPPTRPTVSLVSTIAPYSTDIYVGSNVPPGYSTPTYTITTTYIPPQPVSTYWFATPSRAGLGPGVPASTPTFAAAYPESRIVSACYCISTLLHNDHTVTTYTSTTSLKPTYTYYVTTTAPVVYSRTDTTLPAPTSTVHPNCYYMNDVFVGDANFHRSLKTVNVGVNDKYECCNYAQEHFDVITWYWKAASHQCHLELSANNPTIDASVNFADVRPLQCPSKVEVGSFLQESSQSYDGSAAGLGICLWGASYDYPTDM